jgi:two-component system response regulator AlgR
MKQSVIIVDDELPARQRLRDLLGAHDNIEIVAEAGAGDEAVHLVHRLHPALVLMDIRMPGMSGLESARHMSTLETPPAIIFVTAYDQYALEAFETEAVGYLLKPVRAERLASALERATRLSVPQLQSVTASHGRPARSHIAVRLRDSIRLLPVSDVYFFAADQKYTTVRHSGGSDLIDDSLRELEIEFKQDFIRVHRNAIVNGKHIAGVERADDGQYWVILRDLPERLQVSRRLAGELRERLRL